MKGITIQQPYAHLICQPDGWSHELYGPAKRVENRTWAARYEGPVLIHASKSRQRLGPFDLDDFPDMAFGAVVALAKLSGCVRLWEDGRLPPAALARRPWLAAQAPHHVEGPYCLLFEDVCRLDAPVECPGALGLWDVNEDLLRRVMAQVR